MSTFLAFTTPRVRARLVALACLVGAGGAGWRVSSVAGEPSEQPAAAPAGVALSLFDGASPRGWVVTGCEAVVKDGQLVLQAGDGFVRAHHRQGDFVFEWECKPLRAENYDSGVYFRAEGPPQGKPWPAKHQINLRQGQEGALLGFPSAKAKGLAKAGDWNHYKLTAVGAVASLEINGQAAWKVDGVTPAAGYIGFQSEVDGGGQFAFRNMKITELNHRALLDGASLDGWEGAGGDAAACWQVAEGCVVCTGQKGPWLRSRDKFGDFNLRLEYQVSAGGNSGVYIRVPADGKHHGADAGIEVQVLDDEAPKHAKLQPYQYSGSLYAIAPAEARVGLPAGQWNTLEIDCRGPRYQVVHNGVTIVNADPERFAALKERLLEGHLGLQNHSTRVLFRHLRVGPPLP